MSFKQYKGKTQSITEETDVVVTTKVDTETKSFQYYAQVVNPETGVRYDIPMLKSTDVNYLEKYADYMELKDTDAVQFEKIMEWD